MVNESSTCDLLSLSTMNAINACLVLLLALLVLFKVWSGQRRQAEAAYVSAADSEKPFASGSSALSPDVTLVFPIYFTFLKWSFAFYLLNAVYLALQSQYASNHLSYYALVAVTVVHPLTAVAAEGCTFFLAQSGSGSVHVRRTLIFSAVWYLFMACAGAVSWALSNDATTVHNFVPDSPSAYWMIIDFSRVFFYTAVLVYVTAVRHPRKGAARLAVFELVVYVASTVADMMLAKEPHGFGSACSLFVIWFSWTLTYPFVLLHVLRVDSEYWRHVGLEDSGDGGAAKGGEGGGRGRNCCPCDRGGAAEGAEGDSPLLRPGSGALVPLVEAVAPVGAPGFIIDYRELSIGRLLGVGGSAEVYRAAYKGREVAVKMFHCDLLTPETVRRFAMEMCFAANLRHPNLVEAIGVCVIPPRICLVTELCQRGSLFVVLSSVEGRALSARWRVAMAADCARGLAFLHGQRPPVLHRDLKSLNLLVGQDWRLKLTDFGEARELAIPAAVAGLTSATAATDEEASSAAAAAATALMTKQCGTPQWMAPEVFQTESYTEKVDIYSLGIVLWELGSGERPFANMSPWLVPAAVAERSARPPIDRVVLVPPAYRALVEACWQQDPRRRPSAAEVCSELEGMLAELDAEPPTRARDQSGGVQQQAQDQQQAAAPGAGSSGRTRAQSR